MAYLYPWGNTQELNLDWILQKIKDLEAGSSAAVLDEISNALLAASYAAQAYEQFDIVFQNGKLYLANADIPAPGEAWTPAHWDEILLGGPVSALLKHVANMSSDNVINNSQVTGDSVSDALDTLKDAIDGISFDSDSVSNESQVTGDNVSDALNNLDNAINDIIPLDAAPTENSTKGVTSGGVFDAIGLANYVSPYDWITTNTVTVSGASLPLRQIGNLLYLSGYAELNGGVAGNGAVLGTFSSVKPSGQRRIYGYATYNNVAGFYFFNLNTDGTLTTATGGGQFTGTVQFLDTVTFA